MQLSRLLERSDYKLMQGSLETEVTSVVYDTRKEIVPGACFICISGTVFDGHNYAKEAAQKGASVIVAERYVEVSQDVTLIVTDDNRKALAQISAAWFGYPAEQLRMIGVTGTKGKTTTACMIRSILLNAGIKTDLIGTIEITVNGVATPASHTTPESYVLQEYLRKMADAGTECVVMEVSSQGLKLSRVEGVTFDLAVFTNLEPDHIAPGEHPDFADYLYCKSLLFRRCRVGIANIEDKHFEEVFRNASCEIKTFGLVEDADYCAKNVDLYNADGVVCVQFDMFRPDADAFAVTVDIPGKFNVYNALAAATVCLQMGVPVDVIQNTMKTVAVRGRVELVPVSNQFSVMLDYAHNGMSLRSLLTTLREYRPKRLICLFGCGGNRAKDRRYDMGEVSSEYADLTIVTSDNPRFEEPEAIIADILVGVRRKNGRYETIVDRKEAIRYVLRIAEEGDLVVVAGKGHEDYQEIRGIKYPMDDRIMIREAADELNLSERHM